MTTPVKRYYGWCPDVPDHRDIVYGNTLRASPMPLPPVVDLRPDMPPIYNQGGIGSCTAHAWTAVAEFLRKKQGLPYVPLSRLFLYYNERAGENNVTVDSGAFLRDGAWSLAKDGECEEALWPYVESLFATKPSDPAIANGLTHKIATYIRLNSLNDMLHCLASGYPFVCGISVYTSFESDTVAKTGVVPLPAPNEGSLGGHAVSCVGYNLEQSVFIMRNSWGTDWGQAGYFTIPFNYLTNSGLADDFWTAR